MATRRVMTIVGTVALGLTFAPLLGVGPAEAHPLGLVLRRRPGTAGQRRRGRPAGRLPLPRPDRPGPRPDRPPARCRQPLPHPRCLLRRERLGAGHVLGSRFRARAEARPVRCGAGSGRPAPSSGVEGAFGGALPFERRFVAAIDSPPGLLGAGLALLVAFAVGALHALAPGHGKAVAAGYLIGERARVRHAVALGGTVALMHTGSVLVLGLALYSVARAPDAARLSASIGLVTGVVFVALGGWLLVRRWRSRAAPHAHDHPHPAEPAEAASLSGVVGLGAAGGLLPSPSALLVLLTALAVGRVTYGLTLIAAFSLGLATTVTLVGVAVLRGRDVLHSRAGARLHGLVHAAPLVGAAAVTLVGAFVAVRAGARLL